MKSYRKILITGGKGFIGTNLFLHLKNAFSIKIMDNLSSDCDYVDEDFTFFEGDIRDDKDCLEATKDVDAVIHLAAKGSVVDSVKNPIENYENNVLGTFNILNASVRNGVKKFIFASTGGALMGDTPPPVSESSLPSPISPYGASKMCGEAYCNAFASNFSEGVTILRFANIYGSYSLHKKGLINSVMKNIIKNNPIVVYGDGSATRDFLYVEDLCRGIESALLYKHSGVDIFHLSSGVERTILECVDIIKEVGGKPNHKIIFEPKRDGEIEHNFSINTKAKEVLRFSPCIGFEEGIRLTHSWVNDNFREYNGR
ncbi:MAG: NAD-dependent epimerase/dehydratase family protein [Campylobacterales bacterium]